MTFNADEVIRPAPQLWAPRNKPIRMVEIHSTRGGSKNEYGATKGWMASPNNNQGGWGGSCSYIIAEDGRICRVLDDDQMPTYGAGFGGAGSTYAIDEYAVAVEWCQSKIDTPYTDAQYVAGSKLYAYYCEKYDIPPVMLTIPRQTGDVPAGFVRHDRCENGSKLGKSDPGPPFGEEHFIALVKERLGGPLPPQQEEDDMTPEESKMLTEIRNALVGINIGEQYPGAAYGDSLPSWINRAVSAIVQTELSKVIPAQVKAINDDAAKRAAE